MCDLLALKRDARRNSFLQPKVQEELIDLTKIFFHEEGYCSKNREVLIKLNVSGGGG